MSAQSVLMATVLTIAGPGLLLHGVLRVLGRRPQGAAWGLEYVLAVVMFAQPRDGSERDRNAGRALAWLDIAFGLLFTLVLAGFVLNLIS